MKPSERVISFRRARPLLWKPPTSVAPAVTRSKCEPSCLSWTAVSCGSSFLVNSTRPTPTRPIARPMHRPSSGVKNALQPLSVICQCQSGRNQPEPT